jgi:hypothetical protein
LAVSAAGAADDGSNRTVSAAFFGGGSAVPQNFLWSGWGSNTAYFDYYQWWREHYFMRNLYMNLRIPPKVNPCKCVRCCRLKAVKAGCMFSWLHVQLVGILPCPPSQPAPHTATPTYFKGTTRIGSSTTRSPLAPSTPSTASSSL